MMFRLNLLITFLIVMAASSWVTLQALNYWDADADTSPDGVITIVEATYGMSCREFQAPPPHANRVRPGNATKAVATACDNKNGSCRYGVDVALLGDPAGGCGKDFFVKWRCGTEGASTNEAKLAAEAHGRSINISCPAK